MMNQDAIAKALHNMNPLSEWILTGETYEDLVWHSDDAKPTKKPLKLKLL